MGRRNEGGVDAQHQFPSYDEVGQHCPSSALEAVRHARGLVTPQVQAVLQWWHGQWF